MESISAVGGGFKKRKTRPQMTTPAQRKYKADNPLCEFHAILGKHKVTVSGGSCDSKFWGSPIENYSVEVHHIFGGCHGRKDLLTNLLCLSGPAHYSFSHAFPIDGRILSLWIKWQKGEFSMSDMYVSSGFWMDGWLDAREPEFEFVNTYRLDLIRELRSAA